MTEPVWFLRANSEDLNSHLIGNVCSVVDFLYNISNVSP